MSSHTTSPQETLMTPHPLPPELERLARKRVKAKSGFFMHAVIYLVVNTGLTVLALSKGQSWSIWPAAGWGFGLLMHGLAVFGFSAGSGLQKRMLEHERNKLRASQKED
jgi:hypothetical protein